MTNSVKTLAVAATMGLALTLAACGGSKDVMKTGQLAGAPMDEESADGRAFVMGDDEDGMQFISTDGRKGKSATGIGVNGYLWRASLDTLEFMPLASADPIGGVIITDWYTIPETPTERLKVQVYILDRRLRADGIRVNVFRQERQDGLGWIDASVSDDTKTQMENTILTRARQLRIDSRGEDN